MVLRKRLGKVDDGDALQRKRFHTAKQLHKALKKAQQFLVRKLLRRIRALSGQGAAPAAVPAAAKLQLQLEAAKRTDLAALTQQALKLGGLDTGDGPTAVQDSSAAAPGRDGPARQSDGDASCSVSGSISDLDKKSATGAAAASLPRHKVPDSGEVAALHPSWAAKKQQAAIPQAHGKKIVFDD
ncbi:hypothetical protein WJX81_000818 [Elliptochloris bilobata]|uniref:Bud22 domain-containing protein n=1 Tax=Elliptochloris bilobata TaxID=381761 RepID=A0AAW1RYG4_9CHLO